MILFELRILKDHLNTSKRNKARNVQDLVFNFLRLLYVCNNVDLTLFMFRQERLCHPLLKIRCKTKMKFSNGRRKYRIYQNRTVILYLKSFVDTKTDILP